MDNQRVVCQPIHTNFADEDVSMPDFDMKKWWKEQIIDRYNDELREATRNVATVVVYRQENAKPINGLYYKTMFECQIFNPSKYRIGGETAPNWPDGNYYVDGDCWGGPLKYWNWGGILDTFGNKVFYSFLSCWETKQGALTCI